MTTTEAPRATARPATIAEIVGQTELVSRLRLVMAGSIRRGVKAPHVLLSGPAGHGKTSLAGVIAHELGVEMTTTSGPALRRVGDIAGLLCSLEDGAVLFIDEIHRLPTVVEEALYEALEDGRLSMTAGVGAAARAISLELPPFVLVGATTKPGALSAPLRDRFGFHGTVAPYSVSELATIAGRAWMRAGVPFDPQAATVLAERSKGVPRVALHLAERVMDVAALRREPVSPSLVATALTAFGIGADGLDEIDLRILGALTTLFAGRAVGLDNLAQALDLDAKTIEAEHEGALVRAGLVLRTASGRLATPRAYDVVKAHR